MILIDFLSFFCNITQPRTTEFWKKIAAIKCEISCHVSSRSISYVFQSYPNVKLLTQAFPVFRGMYVTSGSWLTDKSCSCLIYPELLCCQRGMLQPASTCTLLLLLQENMHTSNSHCQPVFPGWLKSLSHGKFTTWQVWRRLNIRILVLENMANIYIYIKTFVELINVPSHQRAFPKKCCSIESAKKANVHNP